MAQMLEGIKVIDMTNNLAAPAATGALADFGATVIHVEKPVLGDDNRKFFPMYQGVSLSSAWINRGKKSLVLDLKDPEGMAALKELIKDADIFVESFRPGVMAKMGLDYESVKAIKPDIVYCSVSAFGQKGPYAQRAGYDIIAQACSGLMHLTGEKDGPPVKSGLALGDMVAAYNAFGCIMAALYYRSVTGQGQHIDVSLVRTLLWCNTAYDRLVNGTNETRTGNHDIALAPYGLFETKDGHGVIIGAVNAKTWMNLCKAMGREDLIKDERFADNYVRSLNQKELIPIIEEWTMSFPSAADVEAALEVAGVPSTKVYDCLDIANDPHMTGQGWVIEAPVPDNITEIKTYPTRSVQADFSLTPGTIQKGPVLGQHNHEILEAIGWTPEKVDEKEKEWEIKYGG